MGAEVTAADLAAMEIFEGLPAAQLDPLAGRLHALQADTGAVLMREGEPAESFVLIHSGAAEICHTGEDGPPVTDAVGAGAIVGEIALLRDKPRTATVTATEPLSGYLGDAAAFAAMADLPGVSERLVRTARQRLAAFITPIPVDFADGTELLLRPVLPGDSARSTHPAVDFSTETLYRRFLSTRAPTAALMGYLFQVDYVDHFVWVLAAGENGPVVADARFVRNVEDPAVAEVAFIVADDYQGRGIGSFLMDALIVAARVGGVHRFTARLLAENAPMHAILDRFDGQWQRDEPGVVTTEFAVGDSVRIDTDLAERIRCMARQVMRAIG
ncbi:MAG: GNAT family N-acetyltransferase [Mycobacterium sp.]